MLAPIRLHSHAVSKLSANVQRPFSRARHIRHHGPLQELHNTMATTFIVAIIGAVGLSLAYVLYQWQNRHSLPLPPGPKGIPLLGNLNDLPKPGELEYAYWLKHKDIYGPISSITVLGKTFVIINDANVALELLRDRAVKHSSRPAMAFAGEM